MPQIVFIQLGGVSKILKKVIGAGEWEYESYKEREYQELLDDAAIFIKCSISNNV